MKMVSDRFVETLQNVFFVEPIFIKTNEKYDDWKEIKRPVQNREILSHFKGNYYVGFISRQTPVEWLCFDLDTHTEMTRANLIYRKDRIFERFGIPHLISRTTSGGLHLIYFLNRKHDPREIRSVIVQSIRLTKGEIELYPSNNGMRLLGGKKCPLVDSDLKILADTPQKVENYFRSVWEYSERIVLSELANNDSQISRSTPAKFQHEIQELLKTGLTAPSTRNDSLLKLNFYYQTYLNYSPEQSEKAMNDWISTKHNEFSKDWKRNPEQVKKQIHSIASSYDRNKINKVKYFPVELLKESNREKINEIALKIAKNVDLELYKVEAFLYDLFAYCKANQVGGIVEIPKTVFQACKFGSRKRYVLIKKELESIGAISMETDYCAKVNNCRKYRILEEFII